MSSSSSARGFPVELRGLEWAIHQALQAELLLKQQQSWTASRRRLLRLQASSNSNCDDDDKDNPIDVFPANEQQLLHQCVEPVLRQMQAIDAEALLGLTRTTEPGRGARLRDG